MLLSVQEELEPEEKGLISVFQELKDSERRIKEDGKFFTLQLDNSMREKKKFVEMYREFDEYD